MTLLEQRRAQRDEEIMEALRCADSVRTCVAEKFADLRMCVDTMARHAELASRFAALVDDLEDVVKYGPGGGR